MAKHRIADEIPDKKPENTYKSARHYVDEDISMEEIAKAAPIESKSWDEYQGACKLVRAQAKELQNDIEALIKKWASFEGQTLRAYKRMPKTDAMFSDSPLSPIRMMSAFRQNLAKLGWKWAAGLAWGPETVKPFYTVVDEACTWGERIVKDQERADKIESAKKAAQTAQDAIKKII